MQPITFAKNLFTVDNNVLYLILLFAFCFDFKVDDVPTELLQRMENSYTVVMFSSPIQNCIPAVQDCIHNISLPKIEGFTNENGAILASTIFNTYSEKLRIEKKLRIVCIDALNSNGELTENNAKIVLTYLVKQVENTLNNPTIDVIILPKFKSSEKDSLEIMEALWYLRQHTVLISASCLRASLPCSEVITVSGATKQHKTPASIVDLVVSGDKSHWLDINLANILSPAVVAVLAIGILDFSDTPVSELLEGRLYFFPITKLHK